MQFNWLVCVDQLFTEKFNGVRSCTAVQWRTVKAPGVPASFLKVNRIFPKDGRSKNYEPMLFWVFRILHILVRIRMRILGSVPLTNGSGCGSVRKSSVTFDFCIKILFCNDYLFQSAFMRKGKDPDPYLQLTDPDADPGGPDPEHSFLRFYFGLSVPCTT